MKRMRVFTLLLLSGVAATAGAAENGFYFGASGGQASYDFDPLPLVPLALPGPAPFPIPTPGTWYEPISAWRPPALGGGVPTNALVAYAPQRAFWIPGDDDEATSWSVLAGYRFLRYLAVELAYHDLGTLHEYSPSRVLGPVRTLEVSSRMESAGATLSFLGQLPITDRWSVYLRAGGLFVDQEISRRIESTRFNDSYDSEVFLYGIGTQFDFGAHWSVRLDFQRFDDVGKGNGIGEADVDALTLGVLFRLGGD